MTKAEKLRALLNGSETILAPCAFDALSARCIEIAGFPMVRVVIQHFLKTIVVQFVFEVIG